MRVLQRLILVCGLATLIFLLWRFDPALVWAQVSQVGAGFLLILPFQICDHLLNALGWLFAFSAEDAPDVPFWRLVLARMAGDGVNYLTPSGSIAGELVRPGLLGDVKPEEIKNTSVVVAKFTQALAQALFILLGMVFVLQGGLNFLKGRELAYGAAASLLVIALVSLALYVLASGSFPLKFGARDPNSKVAAIRERMRLYLRRHPGRFALSILCFMAGYAWGAFEVLLICHFMGLDVSPVKALAVETLSNIIDSLMFMVPAKLGTQEAGKIAIFHGLGYPASQGLAFGLIRHVREVLWAGAGFLIYALSQRKRPRPAPPPESPLPAAEPLLRAD